MRKISIKETELSFKIQQIAKEETIKILNNQWYSLNENERIFVVEFLKQIYPDKTKLINESKWYNTLGDIVGIFDPTGIVDVVNGISYWRQGDKLFAVLSWVSAIPYLGDVIAKPVIGIMKAGGVASKAFKTAALAGDASKLASSAKMSGGPLFKFIESSSVWGPKLLNALKGAIGKVPLIGPGFIKLVEEYVLLFTKASKEMKLSSETVSKLMAKGESLLTKQEKKLLAKELKKSQNFKGFSKYAGETQGFWNKWVIGGMPRLWGNRATRSLMRRTKWYLGLLDFLGIANFVGPDELETQVSDLDSKVAEYSKTQKAQDLGSEDLKGMETEMGGETQTTQVVDKPEIKKPSLNNDAINTLINLFAGNPGTLLK